MGSWPHLAARTAAVLLAAGSLAGASTGCGSSSSSSNGVASKSPEQIVTDTKAAAASAKSVHLAGSIVSRGTPITLDLDVLAGSGARGRLSENGLGFELIDTAGSVYIKGSAAFYRRVGGAAAATLLQGKWLKAPASSPEFASISTLTDLGTLIDTTLSGHGTLSKGATTTIKGTKVIGITDVQKGGTLYVATSGPPYPIEITKSGASGGTVTFDHWNEPLTIKAPAGAIDISQLRAAH